MGEVKVSFTRLKLKKKNFSISKGDSAIRFVEGFPSGFAILIFSIKLLVISARLRVLNGGRTARYESTQSILQHASFRFRCPTGNSQAVPLWIYHKGNDGLHFRQPWVMGVHQEIERLKQRFHEQEKLLRKCEALKVKMLLERVCELERVR
ncbi:hypothetical protein DY000_02031764 [Brassica cretica]|uniref:Uncharacterized protein n=1 Tax=Brassica cretica TaxID=69181 RepID=A0ABQ7DN50_BRACR|nr:hypothetical protein DY000_02031764 [Brassica cretica]